MDDITYPQKNETNKCQTKEVAFFGYVRGTNLTQDHHLHIPGVGDFTCEDIKGLNDPLPVVDDDGVSRFYVVHSFQFEHDLIMK